MAALAVAAYWGGFRPWPDGGMPRRLEVRLESRTTSAATTDQPIDTAQAEGPRANGDAAVGGIAITPPEPVGEMPLLIEGMPGAAQLQLDVDANGKVTAVRVLTSTLESNTEREMIERMRSIRFRPGLENGKPAASRLVLEVRVESTTQ